MPANRRPPYVSNPLIAGPRLHRRPSRKLEARRLNPFYFRATFLPENMEQMANIMSQSLWFQGDVPTHSTQKTLENPSLKKANSSFHATLIRRLEPYYRSGLPRHGCTAPKNTFGEQGAAQASAQSAVRKRINPEVILSLRNKTQRLLQAPLQFDFGSRKKKH